MAFVISYYLIIAIVCAVLLLVMAAMGGDLIDLDLDVDVDVDTDADFQAGEHFEAGAGDGGPGLSPVSPPLLLTFGASFGALGTILEAMDLNVFVVPALAAVISLLITAAVFFFLLKVFIQGQATTRVDYAALVGKEALVKNPIKPGEQGQIVVSSKERGRILITAVSEEDISTDCIVTIDKMVGNVASVSKKD